MAQKNEEKLKMYKTQSGLMALISPTQKKRTTRPQLEEGVDRDNQNPKQTIEEEKKN